MQYMLWKKQSKKGSNWRQESPKRKEIVKKKKQKKTELQKQLKVAG